MHPLPLAAAWSLVRILLDALAMRIFRQDARILKLQTETVKRFGGERFASIEGPQILRLMASPPPG